MSNTSALEQSTMRLVTWRILPFLMLCYFIAFVDRVNVGFAALQMNKAIGLTQAAFGLGGGLFYITYVLFEIPSNLAMKKVGARIWIARILISWGIVAGAMAFVVGPNSFYAMRLLLGAAEAGFFPGVILYLTYWFPREYRARIVAMFMVAIPISSFLGSPISAYLLQMDGVLGLGGWQWMFILEAVPAVMLGLITMRMLPNRPAEARFLSPEQGAWLEKRLRAEDDARAEVKAPPLFQVLTSKPVLAASFIYAGASGASQCLSLWQPQIIKSFGLSNIETGLLNSVPFGIASVLMLLWGRNSDRQHERRWHTALPLALLAASLVASLAFTTLLPMICILVVAVTATYIMKGPFWALSTEWLSSGSAAAGIAMVNAVGNLGGFFGSSALGYIKDATASYPLGLLPLAAMSAVGFVILAIGPKMAGDSVKRLQKSA